HGHRGGGHGGGRDAGRGRVPGPGPVPPAQGAGGRLPDLLRALHAAARRRRDRGGGSGAHLLPGHGAPGTRRRPPGPRRGPPLRMTDAAVVVAEGIVKGYRTPAGYVPVLSGLDLAVPAREMLAITGASGVGKSTLLHV